MPRAKVVLFTAPADQGDILQDFLDWHLDLGVDFIIALDHGSTDGSTELLERYSKTHPVAWFPIQERDITKYSPADELAALARDKYGADWIIHCDADEFLCTSGNDLRALLDRAEADGVTMIDVPRRNVTGAALPPDQRATQALTLRIDKMVKLTPEQALSGEIPAPWIFMEVPGHLIVKASAFEQYGLGAHVGGVKWGKSVRYDELYMLHYNLRGFDRLQTKVRNVESWLDANTHMPQTSCWHWRRFIRIDRKGGLKEEYLRQFVPDDRARELIEQGVLTVDRTVAQWLEQKTAAS